MLAHALADQPSRSQPTAELDRLGDEIAELSAHLEAATASLLALIREFDARGGWNTGFRSCAHWLSWRVGLDLGAARERVRVARALATLPVLADALARGELSYAKVRALTRVATPEVEARLLAVGRAGTAAHVERIVRGWRRSTGGPKRAKPRASTWAGGCMCIQPKTGWWCFEGAWHLRRARCCCGPSTRPERRCISVGGLTNHSRPPPTRRRRRRPARSSGRTRWPCWPRRRCITSSIPGRRESGIRWWCTSMRTCWPAPTSPGSRCWRKGRTFPRKRRGGWHVTRAGW